MIKFFSGSFKETHTPGNSEKTRLVGWDLMRSILWALALLGKDLMEKLPGAFHNKSRCCKIN